jgi:formyltetrahydrofolate deformylase
MSKNKKSFILLFQCKDQKGIVAKVSDFISSRNGNIISADQHTTDPENGIFFMRLEFIADRARWDKTVLSEEITPIARLLNAQCWIFDVQDKLRMGIFASKPGHCLFELLYLWRSGELDVEIPFVASNFEGHRPLVESFNIPFHFIPADKENRKEYEFLSIAKDNTDFLALARYMLILSPEFLKSYNKDIINIHHGFLPSFKGANPYRQAFQEGVKVIGATAHFVTFKLDEGPIICQMVEDVSHKDDVASLVRKGKNLEKHALAKAIQAYINYRIIKYQNRTIVF